MRLKDHVAITQIMFGSGHDEIHIWLDELYKPHLGFLHWKYRHHLDAIEKKYGYDTIEYRVAVFHVLCDWISHCGIFHIPKDEDEVVMWLKDEQLI